MYSEFENFKRRTTKERADLLRSANQETLVSLLPVLDDFDRAQKSIQATEGNDAIKTGVDLVYNKLKNILIQKGLKEMESTNQIFDSEYHEAITKIPAGTDEMKGKVVDTLEKGYYIKCKYPEERTSLFNKNVIKLKLFVTILMLQMIIN
jgi:molecular chaperone GrpE